MRTWLKATLVTLLVCMLLAGIAGPAPAADGSGLVEETIRAEVLEVRHLSEHDPALEMLIERTELKVELLEGRFAGRVLEVESPATGNPAFDIDFRAGDRILVLAEIQGEEIVAAHATDLVRDRWLYMIMGFFLLLLVVVGGIQGAKTIVTLGITGLAILTVLLPLLLKGCSPIGVTVAVSAGVIAVTFVIIAGAGRKTLAAVIGTTGGVVVAGVLAMIVGGLARLSGFGGGEEAVGLLYIPQGIELDVRGLLFAGIIIGALGAVMDVGMSIASAMEEVRRANPLISLRDLIRSGMNVGRDVMGTMSNTLILAYTGSTIPMLLLFMAYDTPFVKVINMELIATEVVRAMAGSIGLILAIPVTALAGGLLMAQRSTPPNQSMDRGANGKDVYQ